MRDIVLALFLVTIGYWANHFLQSLNIGFALTIVSFAIPTFLYFTRYEQPTPPQLRK